METNQSFHWGMIIGLVLATVISIIVENITLVPILTLVLGMPIGFFLQAKFPSKRPLQPRTLMSKNPKKYWTFMSIIFIIILIFTLTINN